MTPDDFTLWEAELAACSHPSYVCRGSGEYCGKCDAYLGPNRSHQ